MFKENDLIRIGESFFNVIEVEDDGIDTSGGIIRKKYFDLISEIWRKEDEETFKLFWKKEEVVS